jgi:abequosyltransferase
MAILSICIPTFNRAEYLKKTLESITCQNRFQYTEDVEIIISDNCSEDHTEEVSLRFIEHFGKKIKYFKNEKNIKDLNFEKVLSYGEGAFLKLNNDTLMHQNDTLDRIIDVINQNRINKDILFFSNGAIKNRRSYHCKDLNTFVKTASFNSTWIACFGIWKEDFDSINDFSRASRLQIIQTDVLFRLISSNRSVYVDNSILFISIVPASKGGYSIYNVFVTNYLGLLKKYTNKNKISRITLYNEKSRLLRYFLIPWTIKIWKDKGLYTFDNSNAFPIVFKSYYIHPLFYISILYLSLKLAETTFKSIFTNEDKKNNR